MFVSISILISAVLLLLLLIALLRLSPFIALIVVAILTGLAKNMPLETLLKSIQNGIGATLGGLVMVLGFGVILGAILSESGAAQQISDSLIRLFGVKRAKIALLLTAFVVGLAMFYNAGFVILIPLVFSVATRNHLPPVYLGIATAASLSVTHGFLPPHPGPMAIALMFEADTGKTLLLGLIVALPTLILAGVIFPERLKSMVSAPPPGLLQQEIIPEGKLPSFGASLLIALIPIVLMTTATIVDLLSPTDKSSFPVLRFLGDPSLATLLAVVVALLYFGKAGKKGFPERIQLLMESAARALNAAAMIFLIIAAGGAFKQVLTDSGIGKDMAGYLANSTIPPLVLAWLTATIVRISVGSATVAGMTAAGIIQPLLIADPSLSKELMVLSIGAGSLMCSHVNDTGFWMFKEYFGLSLKDTFRSWTVMETIVGMAGLGGVLLLNMLI